MIHWSQGLFGFIGSLQPVIDCLAPYMTPPTSVGTTTPPQTPPAWDESLDIRDLQTAYCGGLSPVTVIDALYDRIEKYQKHDPAVWIYLESKDKALEAAKDLSTTYADRTQLPPLFGIPFSVKDSIDIAGLPTTTACPPLAHVPPRSARAYELIMSQGAIFIGKTNLDQLATGLTGCRSPYGIPKSVFNENYISGGSSSGNAVSVGAELVSFSLATDTAGSGRVPAGFNGVIGYKPSRGLISFRGVTPACLSLDCISLTARTVEEASLVFQLCEGYDEEDSYARTALPLERHVDSIGKLSKTFNFGIPPPEALEVCSPVYRRMFHEAVKHLQRIGGTLVPIDWAPFEGGANLLYEGTFVSERMASLPDGWLEKNREHLHPVILELFEKVAARQSTAVQAYRDLQAKQL
jgi:allophanate hydrolase